MIMRLQCGTELGKEQGDASDEKPLLLPGVPQYYPVGGAHPGEGQWGSGCPFSE